MCASSGLFFALWGSASKRFMERLRSSPSMNSINTSRSGLLTYRILGTLKPRRRKNSLVAHSLAKRAFPETVKARAPKDQRVRGNHLKPDQSLKRLTMTLCSVLFTWAFIR